MGEAGGELLESRRLEGSYFEAWPWLSKIDLAVSIGAYGDQVVPPGVAFWG